MADLSGGGGVRDARPPPLGVQILSISCSFWENLAKLCVHAPPGGFTPPPGGNPGSVTEMGLKFLCKSLVYGEVRDFLLLCGGGYMINEELIAMNREINDVIAFKRQM